jgi:hypothetical protein
MGQDHAQSELRDVPELFAARPELAEGPLLSPGEVAVFAVQLGEALAEAGVVVEAVVGMVRAGTTREEVLEALSIAEADTASDEYSSRMRTLVRKLDRLVRSRSLSSKPERGSGASGDRAA